MEKERVDFSVLFFKVFNKIIVPLHLASSGFGAINLDSVSIFSPFSAYARVFVKCSHQSAEERQRGRSHNLLFLSPNGKLDSCVTFL